MFGAFGKLLSGAFGGGTDAAPTQNLMTRTSEGIKDALAEIPGAGVNAYVGGKFAGRAQKDYMDRAYPGTSAHERLRGAAGSAGGQSAGVSDQYRIARLQARNSEKIARIGADAQKYSADRTSEASRGEMASKVQSNQASARFQNAQAAIQETNLPRSEESAKFAKELAEADLTYAQTRNLVNGFANFMKRSGSVTPEQIGALLRKHADVSSDRALSIYKALLEFTDSMHRLSKSYEKATSKIPGMIPSPGR
jgi:hypothetical protein